MTAFTRRGLLKAAAASALATSSPGWTQAGSAAARKYPSTAPQPADTIHATDSFPVVAISGGKIRGYKRNAIFAFKNIPYGADTSGANRFLPPRKPAPWQDVRSCLRHGYVSPQPARMGWQNNEEAWLFEWDDGIQSEDCLNLNVWTPATDGGKRAVMVWLHGGGFSAGSATELPSYDGENLAHRGDVVVVSVTHRLNVFGFLNLAQFGDAYASSSNVGMLDLVAALEWVRDNIAHFGGDPGNVTIFGQSGGGGKVSTLMGMPAARGLFHRAIVESGSLGTSATMESSAELAGRLLTQLGVKRGDAQRLQTMPFAELEAAAAKITTLGPPPGGGLMGTRKMGSRVLGWQPVSGNPALPEPSFQTKAPELSARVPLLVGTTLNEFITATNHPDAFAMTAEELNSRVRGAFESDPEPIVRVFRSHFPGANNFQLWSAIGTSPMRRMALRQARLKHEQQGAPVYLYRFDWQPPVLDGRPMAFHCAEIAFAFDNVARCENMTGNGAAAHALAAKVSQAWINFAKTGDPNHGGLPRWSPYTPEAGGSMIFDNVCAFVPHLDDELQKVLPDV